MARKVVKKKPATKRTTKKKPPPVQPWIMLPSVDYELKLPKPHLSFSQISTYLKCPLQYYNRYVLGLKGLPGAAPAEGSAMDSVLTSSNRCFIEDGKHISLQEAYTIGKVAIEKEFKDVQEDWNESDILTRQRLFLFEIWKEKQSPNFKPITVEDRDGAQWEKTITIAGVPVMVIVDMIEDGCVTDFKVAKSSRFYARPERSLQLKLYAHATQFKKAGFLIFEKEKMRITPKYTTFDLEFIRWWLEVTVSRVAYNISTGSFAPCDPAENFLCHEKWCNHWGDCYGRQEIPKPVQIGVK